ncbi:MAG: hypothetical protein HC932_03000 [Thermales bacterium]|nr:hypothetical protein [Thermales bacterium]
MIQSVVNEFFKLRPLLNQGLIAGGKIPLKRRSAEILDWINKYVIYTSLYRKCESGWFMTNDSIFIQLKQLYALMILTIDDVVDEYPLEKSNLILNYLDSKISKQEVFVDLVFEQEEVLNDILDTGLSTVEIEYTKYIAKLFSQLGYHLFNNFIQNKLIKSWSEAILANLCKNFAEYKWVLNMRNIDQIPQSQDRLNYKYTQGAEFSVFMDQIRLNQSFNDEFGNTINNVFLMFNSISGLQSEVLGGDKTNYVLCVFNEINPLENMQWKDKSYRVQVCTDISNSRELKLLLKDQIDKYLVNLRRYFGSYQLDYDRFQASLWNIYPITGFLNV